MFSSKDFHLRSGEGLPHRLMEDDVYENMYIPKGSLVCFILVILLSALICLGKIIGNIW